MMTSLSSSWMKPAKRLKIATETTKNHRFEPFTQRVAKVKIDPIHRVRRADFGQDGEDTTSHFRSAFEHWTELNLSDNFLEFARRVNPLCESLAQILYHEDKIMSLLVEYIEKRDQLSMEPLLALLAQFARDLGVRFEKHFASAVKLVASVAADHSEVEVVEWSFNCLAWIFKFLSRLLVPDLRQLLGIMAPYLGKERQRPFVARFAAESMSFLICKVGALHYKDRVPLSRAISFLFSDLRSLADSTNVDLYKEGLMALFSDAIRGVKGGLHSHGMEIFNCLLENAPSHDDLQFTLALEVISGVVINIVHHTSVDTFEAIIDAIKSYVDSLSENTERQQAELGCRLVFLCVSTRKGTRVKNWRMVHHILLLLLQKALTDHVAFERALPQLLTAVAYALQTSPMDEMLPFMRPMMDAVTRAQFSHLFLSFCATFSEWGSQRFHSVVLPYFQRFINSSWNEHETETCLTILRLSQTGCVTSDSTKPGYLICPPSWKAHIKDMLRSHNSEVADLSLLNAYSKLPTAISLTSESSLIPDMAQILHDQVVHALVADHGSKAISSRFLLGRAFRTYVELGMQSRSLDPAFMEPICRAATTYYRLPLFLDATLAYIAACPKTVTFSESSVDDFANLLIANLSSPSHELRLASLKILREMLVRVCDDDPSSIEVAIEIEESPLTLQSARSLSMQVRKLAILYPQISSRRWIASLIPQFFFGLFSKKLAPLWDDAAAALKSISEHSHGEKFVSDIAIQWLQEQGSLPPTESASEEKKHVSGEFQCFSAARVQELMLTIFSTHDGPQENLLRELDQEHLFADALPASPRTHGLRVLNAAPKIAEKHSRQIIPLFLSWASCNNEVEAADEPQSTWGFKDRMSFLTMIGQFTNPKSLFRADETYNALLSLLCHGNSEMQKCALKALLAWKSPHLLPYQENLQNILDESRFKEELAVFVRAGGGDDSIIEDEHREGLLPVLLRLLYGRMISKVGAAGQSGQVGRRKVILRTLSHMPDRDLDLFMNICFGPLAGMQLIQDGKVNPEMLLQDLTSPRRQTGLLKMMETVFDTLKSRMYPYAERSINVVLYCLVRACRELEKDQKKDDSNPQREKLLNVLKGIRQTCIRCLDLIFSITPEKDWTPYVRIVFDEVIYPRVENFAIETAQGVSGLLRLFHTWASSPRSCLYLVQFNQTLLQKIVDCLGVDSARDEVKVFVMDEILVRIIDLARVKAVSEEHMMLDYLAEKIRSEVLAPYLEHTLCHLGRLLKRGPSRPVLISGVNTLSRIAPCVGSSRETSSLVRITTYLLRQPPDRVSPKTKSGLLQILEHFLPLYDPKEDSQLTQEVFKAVCSMFDYFKDDTNREVLSRVFAGFAKHDSELLEVASLCEDLNSRSRTKLGADYERRLQAFRAITEDRWQFLSAKQWRPLLYNMLFHVKDEDELAIRSSASFGLKRFMESILLNENVSSEEFDILVDDVLLPALRNGMKQKSELIRTEFLSVLGYFVKLNPTRPTVQDMHVLLVGDDDEASFFSNILHIQQHRRLRALRRLASEAAKGSLQASTINVIFLPLIEHFAFDEDAAESDHNLTAEAVNTIGALAEWLDWHQFRMTFRRYRGYMQSKPSLEKNVLRLLGKISDALSNAVMRLQEEDRSTTDAMDGVEASISTDSTLSKTIPSLAKVATELTTHFIPFLTEFVHHKEDSEMSLRLPAAVTTIKLLKLLSEEEMSIRLPSVLLDVCSVLKSRAQETRDTARKTLNDIANLLGPGYFGYILKELRSTLARGYQLHVLSFTVHSILVATTDSFQQGDLDYCLADLTAVVVDDIFGAPGEEKDAEEYISKMKEVKSSKSFDSMELLAKNATVRNLAHLIRPVQALVQEKLNSTMLRKIDELLRRIGVGLLRNPGAASRDMLVFCYEVIKESCAEPAPEDRQPTESTIEQRFLVKQPAKRGSKRGTTSSHVFKLIRFGLDVLRSILNKNESLLTTSNVAGFLPIIGDAIVQAHEEVKLSALRLLSTVIKLPLADIDKHSNVYLTEAVKIIKESPSTNTEAAQASLKLISAMLRERKGSQLRDGHLAYLLKRLASDIEEPDRQGVTFNFIKAVMARKLVVPEMYELADNIGTMMVTNQTRTARDLARGVYIHFLIEYPQAKNRWTKQLNFLAKNLEYKHSEGRQSVMDAVHMLLSKTGAELAQDIIGTFFLPIVLVMANDDVPECREMAGTLLGELYNRADREQMKTILTTLHSWFDQVDNVVLCSTGLQATRILFEVEGVVEKEKEARFVVAILPRLMQPVLESPESESWEVLYYSLQLFSKLNKAVPKAALSKECAAVWAVVRESLFCPNGWIKACAANLVGLLLADLAKANAATGYSSLPLVGSAELELNEDSMLQLIRASLHCLRTPEISEELATQTVRNIVFLGRCCAQNELPYRRKETAGIAYDSDEDDSEASETSTKDEQQISTKSVVQRIFQQASLVLRRETLTTRAESLIPKTASIGLLAALCRHLDANQLRPSLPVILLPLQQLTDASIPAPRASDEAFQNAYKALVSNSHEILDLLQKKLGTTEYVSQMTRVKDAIKERREGRRVKRRIEAVADPEKYGRDKKRRNERKREKRKVKGMEFRSKRHGW